MRRLVLLLVLASLVAAAAPPDAALRAAQERAVRYFAESVDTADPSWLAIFGYLRRRYGVEVRLATGGEPHPPGAGGARVAVAAMYRRIDDPDARVDKAAIAALPTAIDRITASALHCDRIPLPADWVEILGRASRAGAYALTHAVLATEWTVENGCLPRQAVAALHDEQVELLVQLVDQRAALATRFATAADLWIEAMAMLDYSGAGARLRPEWSADLLALQRPDGAWPRHPRAARADPHTTALALWVVLAQLHPGAPPIRWIAAPRAPASAQSSEQTPQGGAKTRPGANGS